MIQQDEPVLLNRTLSFELIVEQYILCEAKAMPSWTLFRPFGQVLEQVRRKLYLDVERIPKHEEVFEQLVKLIAYAARVGLRPFSRLCFVLSGLAFTAFLGHASGPSNRRGDGSCWQADYRNNPDLVDYSGEWSEDSALRRHDPSS